MGCTKRKSTGSCGHFQCPFANQTPHGYDCVDILTPNAGGQSFCEVGEDCVPNCEYSWQKGDESAPQKSAWQWNKEMDEELRGYTSLD